MRNVAIAVVAAAHGVVSWPAAAATGPDGAAADPASRGVIVVELTGNDPDRARALHESLGRAVASRGWELEPTVAAADVMQVGGCTELDAACVAKGAAQRGADVIVFGDLQVYGERSAVVRLARVDLPNTVEATRTSTALTLDALSDPTRDTTAADLIAGVLPPGQLVPPVAAPAAETVAPADAPPLEPPVDPPPDPPPVASLDAAPPPPSDATGDGELVWGPYSPRPKWKVAFLATSAAITGGALISTIGFAVALSRANKDYNRLVGEPQSAMAIPIPAPTLEEGPEAVCDWAQGDGTVSPNAPLGEACNRGERAVLGTNISVGVAAVGVVGTAVAATLFFVRRSKSAKRAQVSPEISTNFSGLSIRARF